jgi:hypothetical protein
MQRALVILCTLAAACVLAGCTTQSYAPSTDAATQELRIKPGDQIRVLTTRRQLLFFEVTEVRGTRFLGLTVEPHWKEDPQPVKPVEVPFDELALIQVTRFSPGAAAVVVLLVGGIVAAVAAVPAAGLPAAAPVLP